MISKESFNELGIDTTFQAGMLHSIFYVLKTSTCGLTSTSKASLEYLWIFLLNIEK